MAPHCQQDIIEGVWDRPYDIKTAVYPAVSNKVLYSCGLKPNQQVSSETQNRLYTPSFVVVHKLYKKA